jgi:hypothetical protein
MSKGTLALETTIDLQPGMQCEFQCWSDEVDSSSVPSPSTSLASFSTLADDLMPHFETSGLLAGSEEGFVCSHEDVIGNIRSTNVPGSVIHLKENK